jgi:hypothetical protein
VRNPHESNISVSIFQQVMYMLDSTWLVTSSNIICSSPTCKCTWSDIKVCELIAVNVLHTSLLNITVVAFRVLPLGSYAPMPAPSPPFKTIFELVLWNDLQSYRRITRDVIIVIKVPSCQYFLYHREQKKVIGARSCEQGGCSSTVICLLAKNSLTDSAV